MKADPRRMLEPILYKKEEVEAKAIFENDQKTVVISKFDDDSIEGYVRSASRKNKYHRVTVAMDGNRIIDGACSCESVRFYGTPCRHMLRLRNTAVRIGLIQ